MIKSYFRLPRMLYKLIFTQFVTPLFIWAYSQLFLFPSHVWYLIWYPWTNKNVHKRKSQLRYVKNRLKYLIFRRYNTQNLISVFGKLRAKYRKFKVSNLHKLQRTAPRKSTNSKNKYKFYKINLLKLKWIQL